MYTRDTGASIGKRPGRLVLRRSPRPPPGATVSGLRLQRVQEQIGPVRDRRRLLPDDLPGPVAALVELRDPAFVRESLSVDEEVEVPGLGVCRRPPATSQPPAPFDQPATRNFTLFGVEVFPAASVAVATAR